MKNIKKFNSFINEELRGSTYMSAARKMRRLGQNRSADELEDYSKQAFEREDEERRSIWMSKYGELTKYKFNIMRRDMSFAEGFEFSGFDYPEKNLFNIMLAKGKHNTIMTLTIDDEGDITYPSYSSCFMSDRKSVVELIKLLKDMNKRGYLNEWIDESDFAEGGVVDFNDLKFNIRSLIRN